MNKGNNTGIQRVIPFLAAIAIALAILWLYWPILSRLVLTMADSDDYSYGLLFPLVSAFVVYLKWPQLRSRQWQPSWFGLIIIAGGLSLYLVGELAAELYTTRFSFVVVLGGLTFLAGGWALFRFLLFPLLLLWLMLPLPELVTYKLTLPLQIISSRLATFILQTLGVPVLRQGNIIDLGVRQLQIVAACSGLRYILSLLALGIVYSYFFQRSLWKAAVLLVFLIPAAILVNALRVVGMALYPALLYGFWHAFSGWLIFLLCVVFLAAINWTLNRLWPPTVTPRVMKALPFEAVADADTPVLGPYLLAALAVILVASPLVNYVGKAPPVPLRQSFDHFPMKVGPWQGHLSYIAPELVEATRSNAHINANYINPDHGIVSLWIAYYESQKKAGGFVHSPKGCLTASGWKILESGTIQIKPGLPVCYMLVEQMGTRMVVFYWYLQRGRWLASEYLNKFYMGYDGLFRRRTDGALIRLITSADPDLEAARKRVISFTNLIIPVLPQFIPD